MEFIDFTGENQQFKRVPNFEDLSIKEINYRLSRLSLEVRKRDGGYNEKEKAIIKRSGHRSIEGVRTYQREDVNANVAVSSILSGATNASAVFDDVDDETLVNACVEYEKSVNSNLDLSGMLQAASVHGNVHININISK